MKVKSEPGPKLNAPKLAKGRPVQGLEYYIRQDHVDEVINSEVICLLVTWSYLSVARVGFLDQGPSS